MMKEEIENIISQFLEGNANPSEITMLSSWLKESEENRQDFLSYYKAWDLSMRLEFNPQVALTTMHKLIKERHLDGKIYSAKPSYRRYFIYAASIAACAIVAFSIYFFINNREATDIRSIANRYTFAVEDMKHSSDIQLFLSNDNCMALKEKVANIVYNTENVNIDGDKTIEVKGKPYNQLVVPYGHKSLLTLEDGSKIWIKAGTKLLFPTHFAKHKNREIYVDGEIYLEVAHDADAPFIVKSKNINVRVTGTQFDVIAYSDETVNKVILEKGSVNVNQALSDKGNMKKLQPGQMYYLSADKEEYVQEVDVSKYIAWVNDFYDCNDETLQHVANELEKFYGKQIECSPSVASLECSGKLDLQKDLGLLLKDITEVLDIRFYEKHGTYYISK